MTIGKIISKLKRYYDLGEERGRIALEQKGFDGVISRKINRKISAPIAKFLYDADQNINPNYMTLFSTGVGLAGAAAFCFGNGSPLSAIIGGTLAQASSVLDGVDGDYARYLTEEQRTQTQRSFGQYLDTVLDRVVDLAVIYGMGTYLNHVFPDNSWVMPLTYTTMSLSVLSSYTSNQIQKVYSKYEHLRDYVRSRIDLAGRDFRLLTLSLGSVFEGLSYFSPVPQGVPMTISMAIVSGPHLAHVVYRFFELKANLDEVEKISGVM